MTLRPCGREGCRVCTPRPVSEPPDESRARALLGLAGVLLFGLAVVLLWVLAS